MKLGAMGEFPRDRLGPHDEGALRMAISHDDKGNVRIDFGKKVKWLAMPADQAVMFAQLILHHASVKRMEEEQ